MTLTEQQISEYQYERSRNDCNEPSHDKLDELLSCTIKSW